MQSLLQLLLGLSSSSPASATTAKGEKEISFMAQNNMLGRTD